MQSLFSKAHTLSASGTYWRCARSLEKGEASILFSMAGITSGVHLTHKPLSSIMEIGRRCKESTMYSVLHCPFLSLFRYDKQGQRRLHKNGFGCQGWYWRWSCQWARQLNVRLALWSPDVRLTGSTPLLLMNLEMISEFF